MATARILHFPAGGHRYALPIDQVGEIAEILRIEEVPGAAAMVAGVAEHRGRIVTLLSLAASEEPSPAPASPDLAVILAGPHAHLGILVRGRPEDVQTGWRSGSSDPSGIDDPSRSGEATPGSPLDDTREEPPDEIREERRAARGGDDRLRAPAEGPGEPAGERGDAFGFPILLEDGRRVFLIDPDSLAGRCIERARRRLRVLDGA